MPFLQHQNSYYFFLLGLFFNTLSSNQFLFTRTCRMSFEDFCKNYTHIDLCHLINTSFFTLSKTWHEGKGMGEWKAHRCGGSVGNENFLQNPQV